MSDFNLCHSPTAGSVVFTFSWTRAEHGGVMPNREPWVVRQDVDATLTLERSGSLTLIAWKGERTDVLVLGSTGAVHVTSRVEQEGARVRHFVEGGHGRVWTDARPSEDVLNWFTAGLDARGSVWDSNFDTRVLAAAKFLVGECY